MLFQLQYEVQVLRSLSHPNILPFYCSFVTQQEVWHVLPLMQFGMCLPYDYTCTLSNPFKTVPQGKLKGPPQVLSLSWSRLIFIEKLRFPSHLRANVECRGPPCFARAQPCHFANRVSYVLASLDDDLRVLSRVPSPQDKAELLCGMIVLSTCP